MADIPFWRRKRLKEMSDTEWESLCDGCGKCCLIKLEDENTGRIVHTCVACKLLDPTTARCSDYDARRFHVPDCISLREVDILSLRWLPDSCAYLRLARGQELPDWHPLLSGDSDSVERAGQSARGRVISEVHVREEDQQDYTVRWV